MAIPVVDGYAAFASEWGVGENHVVVVSGWLFEAVCYGDWAFVVDLSSDAVEVHVHEAEPGCLLYDFPAPKCLRSKELLFVSAHIREVVENVLLGCEDEAS